MNIVYLVSFLETVNQKSISKAAKNLHMTQSALSQQLQALEKSLNAKLLSRSNKGVELTKEGDVLYSYSETLISLYQNMLKDIEASQKSTIKEIKISSCNSVGEYLLPCTLHLYRKDHKDTKFSLRNQHSKNVVEDIQSKISDIGFIDSEFSSQNIDCIKLCNSRLVFIYSNKMTNISQDISLRDIASLPLILNPEESGTRKNLENLFLSNGISLEKINVEMELASIESIKASVIAGHGVSILPYTSVKQEIYSKVLKFIPLGDETKSCSVCMIYNKDILAQGHFKSFIDYMKKFGRETFC